MNNPLIHEEQNEAGQSIYKMATFDIDVVAKLTGGISPTITYLHKERDVTDDIRAIRFHYENPTDYIEDFASFQAMLYKKEQKAVNELYESISLKPKNMSTGKQVLWSFFVFSLIALPLFIIIWLN